MCYLELARNLTIRSRLLVLAGTLLVVLVATNLYMRGSIVSSNDVLRQQPEIGDLVRTADDALRSFGELKFWLTDLEVSWLNESEDKANEARTKLDEHLTFLTDTQPEQIQEIQQHVTKIVELSLKAVDAYIEDNRVLGNSLGADARASIGIVDQILVDIGEQYKVTAQVAREQAIVSTDRAITVSIAILIVAATFAVALTWVTLRSILGPLKEMIAAVGELANGNTGVELADLMSGDEIGEMAKAVQVFKDNAIEREKLEAKTTEEQRAKEERSRAVESLISNFNESMSQVVDSVSTASSELQTASQSMLGTAEQTDNQASEAAIASESASGNVQSVASAAEELSASIQEIGQQASQSSEIATRAASQADETNSKVAGLVESAQEVGQVVSLIQDIAEQTNLLALNATIEAARAGDAGKGFAVVASEVKGLASQTAKATEQIAKQIAGIQTATTDSAEAIEAIGTTIREIHEIATSVASAVEEQGVVTQGIAQNVQETSDGTHRVASSIDEVKQAASQTGLSATNVSKSADALSQQAETLRAEVDQFIQSVRAA